MKLTGCLLLLTMCIGTGMYAANRLQARTRRLQLLVQLINDIMQDLRYTLPTVDVLIAHLQARPCYHTLEFLSAYDHTSPEQSLPHRLATSIEATQYTQEEKDILQQVAATLGSTDLDGQLSALMLCKTRMESLLAESTEKQRAQGNLYRSMGVLCGLFLVILLI